MFLFSKVRQILKEYMFYVIIIALLVGAFMYQKSRVMEAEKRLCFDYYHVGDILAFDQMIGMYLKDEYGCTYSERRTSDDR